VLMACLQGVVNGCGVVMRDYGIGRRRMDVLLAWPWIAAAGKRQVQRGAIELDVWRDGRPDPLNEGLKQLDAYLACVSLSEGVLMRFDRRTAAPPLEKRVVEHNARSPTGQTVREWRGQWPPVRACVKREVRSRDKRCSFLLEARTQQRRARENCV
jgi:hypothetical protein